MFLKNDKSIPGFYVSDSFKISLNNIIHLNTLVNYSDYLCIRLFRAPYILSKVQKMRPTNGKILIVDDSSDILHSLKQLLKFDFEYIETISKPNAIPELIRSGVFDVIVLDMNFKAGARSGKEGLKWTRNIIETDPDAVVVLITAYGDIELAVEAMKAGGTDFVVKPWEPQKLIVTLRAAVKLSRSKKQVKSLSDELNSQFDPLIYKSEKMKRLNKHHQQSGCHRCQCFNHRRTWNRQRVDSPGNS